MAKNLPKATASTQEHLDIEDVADDLVIFKSGWVGLVLQSTALNFDLLSEAEQDATIYAYGALLNSLTFPVEILIRSKRADITAYFDALQEAERTQQNPDLKNQIKKYEDFIRSIVQQRAVLDKKFYLVINFSPLELGFKGLSKKNVGGGKDKAKLLAEAKTSLYPKRDHIVKQMGRIGLSVSQLSTKELIELYYDIYNPAPTSTQRIILDTSSYTTPIVEPAIEVPTAAPQNQIEEPALPVQVPQGDTLAPRMDNPAFPNSTESQLRPVIPEVNPMQQTGEEQVLTDVQKQAGEEVKV